MSDDRYRDWDAAYVLGSLTSAERHEYEQHLATCPACSRALADLVGMPALLATVSPAEAFSLLADGAPDAVVAPEGDEASAPAPSGALSQLAHRVRRGRARTRFIAVAVAGLAVAAAIAVTLVISLPVTPTVPEAAPTAPPATSAAPAPTATAAPVAELAFTAEVASPLEADAKLADEPWGTRIDWTCSYHGEAGSAAPRAYSMLVTDRQGHSTEIASWTSGPGTTATPTATTSIRRSDIAAVSIVATESGTVLLRSQLSPTG